MSQQTGLIPQWGDATSMFALSATLVSKSEELITQLANQQWYQPYQISAGYPAITAPPKPNLPGTLTLETVTWVTPNQPADFTILPPDMTQLFPSAFTGVAPTLSFGTAPQPAFGNIPASPGVDLNFIYPTASVNLPTAPTLMSLDTITFDDFIIPDFEGVAPTLTLATPTVTNYVEGAAYASDLLDDLVDSLSSALTSGSDTGLDAATQQAMWDAASEREFRAQADALADLDRMGELGYAFPPGVWLDARLKVQTETDYTRTGLSRDIMVKQAELRLENVMKSRDLALTLEGKWIDYTNQVHQRAFDFAKYQTEASVQVYNAQVQAFVAQIEGFKATIAVYDAYIRGVEARVAVLKAHVEFETAKVQINTALVEQYKAQIEAAMSVLEIAKVQVEIIQTQANVEKTKVDIYGAQVQAFVATVNAYTAEVEGYKANAQAQATIEGVFKTQVDAYSAQVQAAGTKATALVEGYKAQVQSYESKLDGYKAQLSAMVEQARAGSEYNQASAAAYVAEVQATAAYNDVLVKTWQAILNEQMQIAQVEAKVAEANGQLAISQRATSIEAIKGATQVMGQLGAAALGAIHWANSAQWSVSDSISSSSSTSNSTVEEHIYSVSA